jgi:hypothetical protein
MQSETPKAIGLVRKDAHGNGVDIHQVAQRYGYRLVWTVYADCGPLATPMQVYPRGYRWPVFDMDRRR